MDIIIVCILFNVVFWPGVLLWTVSNTSRSPIGWARTWMSEPVKTICHCVPNVFQRIAKDFYFYLFFTRSSFFQILYLFLVVTIHVCVINDGLAVLTFVDPEGSHLLLPLLLLGINFTLFVICSYSDPGVINGQNINDYLSVYPYDGQMYQPNNKCTTCRLVKPARSKHCSVYNRCVFKFDHYCIWIRNCVGGRNHRYFLLLLASLTIMCIHGAAATIKVLRAHTHVSKFWITPYISGDGQLESMTFIILLKVLCMKFPRLILIEASLIFLSLTIGYFTIYHFMFAIRNETTNERYKRHEIRKCGAELKADIYNRGILENLKEEIFPCRRIKKVH